MKMSARSSIIHLLLILFVILVSATRPLDDQITTDAVPSGNELRPEFYASNGCPKAEQIVKEITGNFVRKDLSFGAKLLRLHYHDCFVRGCDGSVLLDPVGTGTSEKSAKPNLSLAGFEVIDEIKSKLEEECPGIVSCADILALTARDAVSFPFKKPMWQVLTGRRDGTVSLASEASANLPSPSSNFTTLFNLFSSKGLDLNDLVALSGAHTIGVAHCGTFSRRLFNFTGKGDADPSLDPAYAEVLRTQCPNPATVVGMDRNDSATFNSHYYVGVKSNQGLFQSDAALLTNTDAANIVTRFQSEHDFFDQFGKSMIKMGAMELLLGDAGQVRNNCRVVN